MTGICYCQLDLDLKITFIYIQTCIYDVYKVWQLTIVSLCHQNKNSLHAVSSWHEIKYCQIVPKYGHLYRILKVTLRSRFRMKLPPKSYFRGYFVQNYLRTCTWEVIFFSIPPPSQDFKWNSPNYVWNFIHNFLRNTLRSVTLKLLYICCALNFSLTAGTCILYYNNIFLHHHSV